MTDRRRIKCFTNRSGSDGLDITYVVQRFASPLGAFRLETREYLFLRFCPALSEEDELAQGRVAWQHTLSLEGDLVLIRRSQPEPGGHFTHGMTAAVTCRGLGVGAGSHAFWCAITKRNSYGAETTLISQSSCRAGTGPAAPMRVRRWRGGNLEKGEQKCVWGGGRIPMSAFFFPFALLLPKLYGQFKSRSRSASSLHG